jgi:hypothetical protein
MATCLSGVQHASEHTIAAKSSRGWQPEIQEVQAKEPTLDQDEKQDCLLTFNSTPSVVTSRLNASSCLLSISTASMTCK